MDELKTQILQLKMQLELANSEITKLKGGNITLANELALKKEACVNLTYRIEEEVKKRNAIRTTR